MTVYLKFPQMFNGTLWLLECFTLGPPCKIEFITKLINGMTNNYLNSNKSIDYDLKIFLNCIILKYGSFGAVK